MTVYVLLHFTSWESTEILGVYEYEQDVRDTIKSRCDVSVHDPESIEYCRDFSGGIRAKAVCIDPTYRLGMDYLDYVYHEHELIRGTH